MESTTINNQIKEVRDLFNEIRSNLSREEINRIREKLYLIIYGCWFHYLYDKK